MKVSYQWLNNYVSLEKLSPQKIAEKLTFAGLEVEAINTTKQIAGLCAAFVEKAEKHPKADKLKICTIFDGENEFQVVCGAPNVVSGQTVVLARPGTALPNGLKISEAKIRGIHSCGMLCSEQELGISDNHEGIIVLDDSIDPGKDVNDLLGLGDTIFDIAVMPNRGDCLSIYGIAREIAAIFDRPLTIDIFAVEEDEMWVGSDLSVNIENHKSCHYYSARVLMGVKVGPSPFWMQKRLKSAGLRPINNIVDITNYVMIEYGQPLHAFDLNLIDGGIIVRNARKGEKITTLDGKERILDESVTVIADHKKALGLAGVMGGEYSGINDETTDLFLECACFSPESVAITSRKFGINSDSAYRYARGIDYSLTRTLLDYVSNLITNICGGCTLHGALTAGEIPPALNTVTTTATYINKLIGKKFSPATIVKLLKRLRIIATASKDKITASIPAHRSDISHGAALAEEVARLYGLSKIPFTMPKFTSDGLRLPPEHQCKKDLRHRLASLGFNEVINYSFMSKNYLELFGDVSSAVSLINPISEEMSTLRTSVYPGLVRTLESNWNQGARSIKIFEFATVFMSAGEGKQPKERSCLALGVMGDFNPLSWIGSVQTDTFFHLKGACDNLFAFLGINAVYEQADIPAFLHPGKSAMVSANKKQFGFIGALHPDITGKLDLKSPVYLAEFDFAMLIKPALKKEIKYRPFSKFPPVYKDISIVVPKTLSTDKITYVLKTASPLVQDIILYDVYSGTGFADNERSVTFRIFFISEEKTLTDEEINPILMGMAETLRKEFGAKLR
ncbi:MAG: phenylalanine--tRNA ligase subunit beta [Deferribacteraceae bacterium]|jgi:phenylalanyl-tRNA synthetase beta chain|nr:phenylalanine--tRNA ligase subunit beta [Deferribacteraceae bacterium]